MKSYQNIDLSLIVLSYNTKKMLEDCIRSIYATTQSISFEVFVVDDNSRDGSPEMVREKFPQVKLIVNPTNLGYAKSNNIALRQAQGRYCLLLNSDVLIQPHTFSIMVEFMDTHPMAGAAGCELRNPDGSLQYCIRDIPDLVGIFFVAIGWHKLFPKSSVTARYYQTKRDYSKIQSVESLGTTCFIMRREMMNGVGLLDETFFMYNVDLDYCKKIRLNGWEIYYLPQVYVIHFGGQSVNQRSYRSLVEQHQGMIILYDRYFRPNHNFLVNQIAILSVYFRLGCKLIANFFTRDKRVIKGPGAPAR